MGADELTAQHLEKLIRTSTWNIATRVERIYYRIAYSQRVERGRARARSHGPRNYQRVEFRSERDKTSRYRQVARGRAGAERPISADLGFYRRII